MADYVLDKGMPVLSTYNSSNANGVTAFRAVKYAPTAAAPFVDLNVAATTMSCGVVQENVDAVKVATGKVVVDVRVIGITKLYVQTGTSIALGSRVTVGNAGGAVLAASGNQVTGVVTGLSVPNAAPAAGDLIDVLLTPGLVAP